MSYKPIKQKSKPKLKPKQKQKKSHMITYDLITGNQFDEIVTILNGQSELTNRDQYLYGYSLLRTQQQLASLVALWPLAAKGHAKLQEDCALIAAEVFKNEDFLLSTSLSEETLYTLFLVARSLFPGSVAFHHLRQCFFDRLWQEHHYEKLEKILKSSKDEFSGILVENLSKLTFFQSDKKFFGNIPAFVSHILTGGACLIARNPMYHEDIALEIHGIANEIKQLFIQLENRSKQKLACDKTVFESYVDYEANILIQVLPLAIKNSESIFEIVPTPGYLINFDSTHRGVGEKFLSWLATENHDLFELYDADVHHAVLFALGMKNSSDIKNIVKLSQKNKFHPYLRLALMFCTVDTKKNRLDSVQLSDFQQLKENTILFNNVLLKTMKLMINRMMSESTQSKIKGMPNFIQKLQEFYPILQKSKLTEFKNILIVNAIFELKKQYGCLKTLNFDAIKKMAIEVNDDGLVSQIEVLCVRQKVCLSFLLNFQSEKKSKESIKSIKNKATLLDHLALFADSCLLIYSELSEAFFLHFLSLLKDKRINKLIPLKNFIDDYYDNGFDLDCGCAGCRQDLYEDGIPHIINELKLSVARLPDPQPYLDSLISNTQTLTPSILLKTDPFKMLDASLTDTKSMMMQKVMNLIKQAPEKMAVLRQAQSELFNPAQRFLHHYFRYIAYENRSMENETDVFSSVVKLQLHEIPFRHEFVNAHE